MHNTAHVGRSARLVKRTEIPLFQALGMRLLAILLALITGGLFILVLRQNPFAVYAGMIKGALGTRISRIETVKLAIPLCVCALGLALSFRMRFWNIGAEGQICVGAIAASYFALFQDDLPHVVLLFTMAAAAMVAAGLWGMIPAYCKARFGTNETLFTLMLNYIALFAIQFLREGPWRDPANIGFPTIARFAKNALLPKVFGIHVGWIVAIFLVLFVWIYLRYTKHGYELAVVGENMNTARYAGMNVRRIILRTVFVSAAICGLAGMLKVSGADRTLAESVSGGVGFTAIIVSWLAALNPFVILIISLLFGVMQKGSGYIQSIFKISTAAADMLQGIILFFVLGCEFFVQFRVIWERGDSLHD
ncbi:MAG: ABC transporter permease [Clostridia bacterium]